VALSIQVALSGCSYLRRGRWTRHLRDDIRQRESCSFQSPNGALQVTTVEVGNRLASECEGPGDWPTTPRILNSGAGSPRFGRHSMAGCHSLKLVMLVQLQPPPPSKSNE